MTEMKRVTKPEEVPPKAHFAVIIYSRKVVHHEGDQRSRECPGHGYPAYDEQFDTFEHWVTESKPVLESFLQELEAKKTQYSPPGPYVVLQVMGKGVTQAKVEVAF